MSALPFSWMWGDPAESMDRLRAMREQMAKAEQELKERERRRKARRIRKLVKAAKAGKGKGQQR